MAHWVDELENFQVSPAFSSLLYALAFWLPLAFWSSSANGKQSWEIRGWEEEEVSLFPFSAVVGQCLHCCPEDCISLPQPQLPPGCRPQLPVLLMPRAPKLLVGFLNPVHISEKSPDL